MYNKLYHSLDTGEQRISIMEDTRELMNCNLKHRNYGEYKQKVGEMENIRKLKEILKIQ